MALLSPFWLSPEAENNTMVDQYSPVTLDLLRACKYLWLSWTHHWPWKDKEFDIEKTEEWGFLWKELSPPSTFTWGQEGARTHLTQTKWEVPQTFQNFCPGVSGRRTSGLLLGKAEGCRVWSLTSCRTTLGRKGTFTCRRQRGVGPSERRGIH